MTCPPVAAISAAAASALRAGHGRAGQDRRSRAADDPARGVAARPRHRHRVHRVAAWRKAARELFHPAEPLIPTRNPAIRLAAPRTADYAMLARSIARGCSPCRGKRVRAGSARGGASLDTRIERRKTGRHRGARAYEHPNLHPQPGRQRRARTTGRRGSRRGGFPLSAGASHERGDKPRPAAIVCGCAGGS